MIKPLSFAALASALLLLTACGGSSSSNNDPIPTTGGLTLLVGDSPEEDFDAIVMTVENAILIGNDDGQVDLGFEDPVEVDLLELSNLTEVLATVEVPTGSYSKIRLIISDLQLQELDDTGQVVGTPQRPPLPANGHIDLNPQGTFDIVAGDTLIVEIDVDLERSLKLTSTGSGEYRFRPVVFVEIDVEAAEARLTRTFGRIAGLDANAGSFDLCDPDDADDCIAVQLTDDALLIDEVGAETAAGGLADDLLATLFGRFDGDTFAARVLALGEEDGLVELEGTIGAAPDAGVFPLVTEEDGEVTVSLYDGTLLLDDDGAPTTIEALVEGAELEAWAILPPGETSYRAVALQLDDDEESSASDAEAEGTFVAYADGVINLVDEQQFERCVLVDDATLFMSVADDSAGVESEEFDLAEFVARLDAGTYDDVRLEIDAEGAEVDGCIDADAVVLELED